TALARLACASKTPISFSGCHITSLAGHATIQVSLQTGRRESHRELMRQTQNGGHLPLSAAMKRF
ncbi:hypothetical protein ACC674_39150, partial [Rhizobium ruizarguesonis]